MAKFDIVLNFKERKCVKKCYIVTILFLLWELDDARKPYIVIYDKIAEFYLRFIGRGALV